MAEVASTIKNAVVAVNGYHGVEISDHWMPEVELGLMVWHGEHQGVYGEWLRWCDQDGVPIPTGQEKAEQERQRVQQEQLRADQERLRAERLAAKLRALGIEDDA